MGKKCPLLLISGLLSNHVLWQHQVDHLKDMTDIHVISPSQNSAEKMVQEILDQAPPTFALAGHSMGGWLCLEVMKVVPASRVTKLCLLNTTWSMDSEEKRKKRQEMIERVRKGEFQQIVKELAARFVLNPLVKNDVEKMFLEVGQEVFIRQETAMLQRAECHSVLATISCPTVVIHAAQDALFSLEEQKEFISQISTSQLAVVENSGHMSPLERTEIVTRFLKDWLHN